MKTIGHYVYCGVCRRVTPCAQATAEGEAYRCTREDCRSVAIARGWIRRTEADADPLRAIEESYR